MNYATSTVTKYTNCPDNWESDEIENYLYGTLGLKDGDIYYIAGDAIPFLKEEYGQEDENPGLPKGWKQLKRAHPDTLLLFRCGDFYEAYEDDAAKVSDVLYIALTRSTNRNGKALRLSGFPYHALDTYLPKLIRAGLRVAICEAGK